jgi:phosphatidylethanolamine/phosphatidyl-N-methylethanolamine N-methyltransferase
MSVASPKPKNHRGTGLFLKRWLRRPLRIGAVAPSGAALSRAMAKTALDLPGARNGIVVELGAGTGSFTSALLEEGLDRQHLVSLERDPELIAWLQRHFPGLRVLPGDAARLPELLAAIGVREAQAVISGLPLLSMPRTIVRAIVGGAFSVLSPQGAFIQFTYGPTSPVPRQILDELGLEARNGQRIWRNVPPAVVWTFRRRA